jgi:hypothetical protein
MNNTEEMQKLNNIKNDINCLKKTECMEGIKDYKFLNVVNNEINLSAKVLVLHMNIFYYFDEPIIKNF